MNNTPPMARLSTSRVFGAVWPMYCPTRSSRVTAMRWPLRTYPRRWRISAIRTATVVLPVPGLPVKLMCSDGAPADKPSEWRSLSTRSSAAMSRMRLLTGSRPMSSRSSLSNTSPMLDSRKTASRSSCGARSSMSISLSLGALDRVRPRRVLHVPATHFAALEGEAWLLVRPADDERQAQRLAAERGIKGIDLDVMLRKRPAARLQLRHDSGSIPDIEHGLAEHFPVGVAWVRVVGVFDRHGPTIFQAVLDLAADLRIGQIGQEGKGALGESHVGSSGGHLSRRGRRGHGVQRVGARVGVR